MNNISNVDQVLMQMRVLAAQASAAQGSAAIEPPKEGADFSKIMSNSINAVNDAQKASGDLKKRFEMGDESVNMVDLAIASEKSKVAFTAMTQTRNKLVEAYKSVMSMPI